MRISARSALTLNRAAEGKELNWANVHRELHCSPVTVHNLLKTLEKRGLVKSLPKPWNRLSRRVEITSEGRDLLGELNGQ